MGRALPRRHFAGLELVKPLGAPEQFGQSRVRALQRDLLDLAYALAREIHEGADAFERHVLLRGLGGVGNVQRARPRQVPRLDVWKVELEGAGLVDVRIQVIATGDVGTRSDPADTLAARARPVHAFGIEKLADLQIGLGETTRILSLRAALTRLFEIV